MAALQLAKVATARSVMHTHLSE